MLDQLSAVAPARVRAVLLPIGQIKRARFLSFVERLQRENIVQLGDISPDGRPNRNMFSPLAFPTGRMVYDLTTHCPPASYAALYPFEIYREALVIIAIADGAELEHVSYEGKRGRNSNPNGLSRTEHNLGELYQELEEVRDTFPKALVHQLFLFDHSKEKRGISLPEGLVPVSPPAECKTTTMKTIMCDISSLLLAEMTTLAKSLQALSTIDFPGQSLRQLNGVSWNTEDRLLLRNPQYLHGDHSRNGSPAANADRNHARMSMPPQTRTDSNSSLLSARPSTPNGANRTELPTTFDEIMRPGSAGPMKHQPSSRFGTPDHVRDASRDRVSVQGFGSGSLSERSRNKGKARVGVVIGSLYLCAGRWGDALREFVESATLAKTNLDHLWHAKALDNILVAMLMYAWTGLDFQIPQVCYASPDKWKDSANKPKGSTTSRLVAMQNLVILIPELVDRILNLYTRAGNNTGESLPQLPHSETIIRFSKLLSTVHLAGGSLNDEVLELLVLGTPFPKQPNVVPPRLNIKPTRTDIVMTVFHAFPNSSSDQLSLIDRIIVLSGIASVLGSLGYDRKKALVIRELVSALISGLVQARIKGAADMGVHPAAGLAALGPVNGNATGAAALDLGEGDVENGVDAFLTLLTRVYGVVTSESSPTGNEKQNGPVDDSDEAVVKRIIHNASIRLFGSQNMKMDVLRSCINLSEALPDFNGVLTFSVDLLRTAGSGVAPGPRYDASPSMSREEQVRLATNISRTLSAARNLGVNDLAADYWDEFLVRGVELEPLPPSRTSIPHSKSELPGVSIVAIAREKNPFIYNPFLKAPNATAVDHLMVAGEMASFKVTLQNPYEFDLELEHISLESQGAEFDSSIQRTVIGPYRTQILMVQGTPKTTGSLKITGCIVQVRGCRERRFPIFVEPWSPQSEIKVKTVGLAALSREKTRPSSTASKPVNITPTMSLPKPKAVGLNVIEKQPIVIIKSTILAQSAIMVLEGERQKFSITLQNLSREIAVDLIQFSFKDSTQEPLQTAMSNRDASPAELYEYELVFARKQALRWVNDANEKPYIKPGGTATFDIEVLGKPGLTSASVQIDYSCLGVAPEDVQDKFYTRQISLPLTVTVNASIELIRMEAMPLTGNVPSSLWSPFNGEGSEAKQLKTDEYCLVLLDFRNTWPKKLLAHLEISGVGSIDEEIMPGNTSRILVPVRRIFLEDPHASVPALDPSRQRQFVISTGRISADSERASREAFWYREELLRMLKASWRTKLEPPRQGEIELRAMRLSQRAVEVIAVDEIGIDIFIGNTISDEKNEILADTFSSITVRITNRSKQPIFPLLRVQPAIRHRTGYPSVDLSKKFVWNGTLQQTLPIIPGQESTEFTVGMTALCRGEYEISASVEEVKLSDQPEEKQKEGGRQRTNTRTMMDAVLGPKTRRIWHSREPCLLVVSDAEVSSGEDEDGEEHEAEGEE